MSNIMELVPAGKKILLCFGTLEDISQFKEECECETSFTHVDSLTLVGRFSFEQLKLATKNRALCKVESN